MTLEFLKLEKNKHNWPVRQVWRDLCIGTIGLVMGRDFLNVLLMKFYSRVSLIFHSVLVGQTIVGKQVHGQHSKISGRTV